MTRRPGLWAVAQSFLARREYSRAELRSRLCAKEFSAEDVEALLDDFVARGWQSDERFANSYVRIAAAKGKGPVYIRNKLRQRGIDSALLEHQLTISGQDWADNCRRALVRKFGQEPIAETRQQARAARFLASRGFSSELIFQAIETLKS